MRTNTKVIGIVGGMGPQAGVALHEAIIRNTPVVKDQDHLSVILMTYPGSMADRTAFLEGDSLVNPAHGILEVIEKLRASGAEVIGIPCNTAHAPRIFERIEGELNRSGGALKLVHLPAEVINALRASRADRRLGLMATNGTYKSKIYQDLLASESFDLIVPDFDFQDQVIHRLIYDPEFGIKAQSVNIQEEAMVLWHQALDFFRKNQVKTILLACTELALLNRQEEEKEFTFIDTTEVLAKALIREVDTPIFQPLRPAKKY